MNDFIHEPIYQEKILMFIVDSLVICWRLENSQ